MTAGGGGRRGPEGPPLLVSHGGNVCCDWEYGDGNGADDTFDVTGSRGPP